MIFKFKLIGKFLLACATGVTAGLIKFTTPSSSSPQSDTKKEDYWKVLNSITNKVILENFGKDNSHIPTQEEMDKILGITSAMREATKTDPELKKHLDHYDNLMQSLRQTKQRLAEMKARQAQESAKTQTKETPSSLLSKLKELKAIKRTTEFIEKEKTKLKQKITDSTKDVMNSKMAALDEDNKRQENV